MLVKQVETLLFIVCVGGGGESGKFAENERGKYGQDVSWAQCKSVLQAVRVCGGRGESNPSAPCTRRPPPEKNPNSRLIMQKVAHPDQSTMAESKEAFQVLNLMSNFDRKSDVNSFRINTLGLKRVV